MCKLSYEGTMMFDERREFSSVKSATSEQQQLGIAAEAILDLCFRNNNNNNNPRIAPSTCTCLTSVKL